MATTVTTRGYEVFVDGLKVGTEQATSGPYVHRGSLVAGRAYTFQVRAIAADGTPSALGPPVTRVALGPPPGPDPPTGLTVQALWFGAPVTGAPVFLFSWDAVPGAVLYRIYADGVQVNTATVTNANWVTGVQTGVTYQFTVRAETQDGQLSEASTAVPGTGVADPGGGAVTAPTGLTASSSYSNGPVITLDWADAVDEAGTTYTVERVPGGAVGTATGSLFTDTVGLEAGRTYEYRVRAVRSADNAVSALSAPVTVTAAALSGSRARIRLLLKLLARGRRAP